MLHDRYAIAASLLMASFLLRILVDMNFLNSVSEGELLDWTAWILGTAGIFFFGIALQHHRKKHR